VFGYAASHYAAPGLAHYGAQFCLNDPWPEAGFGFVKTQQSVPSRDFVLLADEQGGGYTAIAWQYQQLFKLRDVDLTVQSTSAAPGRTATWAAPSMSATSWTRPCSTLRWGWSCAI
jgi:hypothetical protein